MNRIDSHETEAIDDSKFRFFLRGSAPSLALHRFARMESANALRHCMHQVREVVVRLEVPPHRAQDPVCRIHLRLARGRHRFANAQAADPYAAVVEATRRLYYQTVSGGREEVRRQRAA